MLDFKLEGHTTCSTALKPWLDAVNMENMITRQSEKDKQVNRAGKRSVTLRQALTS